jgi:predicted phage-related endonuclease
MATSLPGAASAARANSAPDEEIRHTFVGGSEAFELLNEKQYGRGCARALAYRKLRTPEDVQHLGADEKAVALGAILNRGHRLEDLAAQLYMEQTGRSVIRRRKLVHNPDHPGAAVHTDRIICAHRIVDNGTLTEEMRPTGDAEIKSHGEGPFYHILRGGLPPAHNLQIQWSLFCTGHTWGAFIILGVFGGLPLRHFDVERDQALMNIFAHAVENFWNTLKAGDLPPQLSDPADLRCKVCPYRLTCRGEALDAFEHNFLLKNQERKKPLVRIENAELDEALGDRAVIMSEIAALTSESEKDPGALQLVNNRIRELLTEAGITDDAEISERWRIYQTEGAWSGLDQQRLKTEQPEIYKKFYIEKRPTGHKNMRVFAVGKKRAA